MTSAKVRGRQTPHPGHGPSKTYTLEKVTSSDPQHRKERESYLIRKFNSFLQRSKQAALVGRPWPLIWLLCADPT